MADITVTTAQVDLVYPDRATKIPGVAGEAIDAGEVIYQTTDGEWILADGSAAASVNGVCLALDSVAAGGTFSVLVEGMVTGFTLTSIAYNTAISVSDTAGALDNGAGSPTKVGTVARVWGFHNGTSIEKALYFRSNLNTIVT